MNEIIFLLSKDLRDYTKEIEKHLENKKMEIEKNAPPTDNDLYTSDEPSNIMYSISLRLGALLKTAPAALNPA